MSFIDEIDKKILKENFSEDLIKQIDIDNAIKIFNYLKDNDVFYAKDLFLNSFDLFLLPCEIFINKFEYLKKVLGNDFVDKLGEDKSLIEIMYEYNV